MAIGQHEVQTYKIADMLKNKGTPLFLDDYTKAPEFIPLETKADCLMDIPLQIDANRNRSTSCNNLATKKGGHF